MRYSVQITENERSIKAKINKAIAEEFNDRVKQEAKSIISEARDLTTQFFKNTPTFFSLAGGELEGHFGFPIGTGEVKAMAIVNRIAENMEVLLKPFVGTSNTIRGGLTFYVLISDFSDILDTNISSYLGRNKKGETYIIPWLEWLLLHGSEIILTEYKISFKTGSGRSRQAIMLESSKGWGVPDQFAGTKTDNWLTKRLEDGESEYIDGLGKIIKEHLF